MRKEGTYSKKKAPTNKINLFAVQEVNKTSAKLVRSPPGKEFGSMIPMPRAIRLRYSWLRCFVLVEGLLSDGRSFMRKVQADKKIN